MDARPPMARQFNRRGSFLRDAEEGVGGVPHSVAGCSGAWVHSMAFSCRVQRCDGVPSPAGCSGACDGVRIVDEGEDGVQHVVSRRFSLVGHNFYC